MKKIISFVLAMVMLLFTACAAREETKTSSPETASVTAQTTKQSVPEGIDGYTILLMGSSEADFSEDSENPYALTHILITIDPEGSVLKFVTFPYNLLVDVETEDGVESEQLQFVCNSLGPDETVTVLEENFGIDIDYWVLMNMAGVSDIVDALGGIEIDLADLSINDIAEYAEYIVGQVWVNVTKTGLQILSGLQTAGYFFNTMYDNPTAEEEENRFREHHRTIITAVVQAVELLQLQGKDLVTIAENVEERYTSNIPEDEWQQIADSALYCVSNDPQFLHVPQTIEVSGWDIVYDPETDVSAVQQFIGE